MESFAKLRRRHLVKGESISAIARDLNLSRNTVPGLWLLGVNQRLMARQKRGVFHVDLAACNAYQRPIDSLSAITAPTLLIAGSQDRMTSPKVAKAVQAAIPGARLASIEGSGHALMAERPDAVLDALIGFLASR